MSETLCDWSKSEIRERVAELAELVRHPKFYCRKCARVAAREEVLCKPIGLPLDGEQERAGACAEWLASGVSRH